MVNKTTGKNTTKSDTSTVTVVQVGSLGAKTLVAADDFKSSQRTEVTVTNNGVSALWIKEQEFSVDSDKTGKYRLSPGETRQIVGNGEIYTGEISAIFESGTEKPVVVEVT